MAIKKIEIRPKGLDGTYADVLYPKTSMDMVVNLNDAINNITDELETKVPADDYGRFTIYGTTTGTGSAYVLTPQAPYSAYTYLEGGIIRVKIHVANTGSATINVNGKGAKNILKSNGFALSAGNLKAGSIYTLAYNGTSFILQGEGGEYGTAQAGDVLTNATIGTEAGLVTGTLALTGNATTAQVLAGQTFYNTLPKTKSTGTMPNLAGQDVYLGAYDNSVKSLIPHPQDPGGQALITLNNASGATGYIAPPTTFNINMMGLVPSNIREGATVGRYGGTNGVDMMVGTASVASMGGKLFATGTTSNTTAMLTFIRSNGAQGNLFYYSVSGLTFNPSVIIAFISPTSNNRAISVYNFDYRDSLYAGPAVMTNSFTSGSWTNTYGEFQPTFIFRGDQGAATVANGGFTMPISTAGAIRWYAYQ